MAKFMQFHKKRRKEKEPQVEKKEPPEDPFKLLCKYNWDDILADDVFAACRTAVVRHQDIDGAVKLLSAVSHSWRFDFDKCVSLDSAWRFTLNIAAYHPNMASVLDIFAHAERDRRGRGGEKSLMNFLMETLLSYPASSEGLPTPARQLAQWCRLKGYYAFGFDVALSSENYDEAFSILATVEAKGKEYVLMLLDVASQLDRLRAAPFVDHCRQNQHGDFAFSLAACLKQWPKVGEMVQAGVKTSLLRMALGRAVSDEKWDIVRLLLEQLSEQEVVEELLASPRRVVKASAVVDLLLERDLIPGALRLACSFGLTMKAAQIMRKDFVMDRALSAHVANACFDNHCGPDQFLGMAWSLELLEHILDAPRGKPFSENQWRCVRSFVESGKCPQEGLEALVTRAVDEDAACLPCFVGRGVDEEMMDSLLATDPDRCLSDVQLGCVTTLLYREASNRREIHENPADAAGAEASEQKGNGEEAIGQGRPSDEDGSFVSQARQENEGHDSESGLENSTRVQGDVSELPEEDWSTAVPHVQGVPPHPWRDVMRAAQRAKHSKHLRPLAIRAAYEGQWNCLICLAIEGLRQHPLDLLLSLLHPQPERLVLSYIREREYRTQLGGLQCYQEGWRDLRLDLDIPNLQDRGLLEERHRVIMLKRALAREDWHTAERFASLDLPLSERRAVFVSAMDKRRWPPAMEMFDLLPDEADLHIFRNALTEVTPDSSDLKGLMVERGLFNPYFAPKALTDHLREWEEKAAVAKASGNAKTSFWNKLSQKSRPQLSADFRRPNSPILEEERDRITSRAGKKVQKAARKGDWGLVMNLYEGGMGEAVKMAVLHEAMQQGKWSVVTTLIRRDPEATIFYRQCRQVGMCVYARLSDRLPTCLLVCLSFSSTEGSLMLLFFLSFWGLGVDSGESVDSFRNQRPFY